jgi:hypothetical protein
VHRVQRRLLPGNGQHAAHRECVHGGLLLPVVDGGKHAANRLPDRLLLPRGLGRRHPVPPGLLWLRHRPQREHVHGHVHGGLLREDG